MSDQEIHRTEAPLETAAKSDSTIKGDPVSLSYEQQLEALQKVFDPQAAMTRINAYGTWLFGSSAIVGALGAGFSNTALSKLRGAGIVIFAVAVSMFGISLVFASFSMAPHWQQINLNSLDNMVSAIDKQFRSREKVLKAAAVAFAIALLLGAFSPLISLAAKPVPPVVKYTVDDKGDLKANLQAAGLIPGVSASLRLEATDASKQVVATSGSTADESGQITLELDKPAVTSVSASLDLVSCISELNQSTCSNEQRFHIR